MKRLIKICVGLLLLILFSFAFSSEDSRIYLEENRKEPAKLTIGVTKLKTKELPMAFDIEKKIIYAELPEEIGENDLIFVSETLDEIPSLSTTNGRKRINNIKKYLTKDIKVAPKFTYQIVVGDKENGVEEWKRYLVIKCKTNLSGVYVYVVEKESYHVKNVYKGNFNIEKKTLTSEGSFIKIMNPIVKVRTEGSEKGLGRVIINGTSAQTVTQTGAPYNKNGNWINADISRLSVVSGEYNVRLSCEVATTVEGRVGEELALNFNDGKKTRWKFSKENQSIEFGVEDYDFEPGTYNVKIEKYNPTTNEIYSEDYIKVEFPEFDATIYSEGDSLLGATEILLRAERYSEGELLHIVDDTLERGGPYSKLYTKFKDLDVEILDVNGGLKFYLKGEKVSHPFSLKKLYTREMECSGGFVFDLVQDEVRYGDNGIHFTVGYVSLRYCSLNFKTLKYNKSNNFEAPDDTLEDAIAISVGEKEVSQKLKVVLQPTLFEVEKVSLKFENEKISIDGDKGWIDFESGIIDGYDDYWGRITPVTFPPGTEAIAIFADGGFGRKEAVLGKAIYEETQKEYTDYDGKITLKFENGKLKFGVKPGNYALGNYKNLGLICITHGGKVLKKIDLDVFFKNSKLFSTSKVRFLNPMMKLESSKGKIEFSESNPLGKAEGDGNHSFINGDAKQWWEVSTNIKKDTSYGDIGEIYDENGKKLGERDSFKVDGITFEIGETNNKDGYNLGIKYLGGYNGRGINKNIFVEKPDWRDVRFDKINLIIDEFEPNAYGKVVPTENGMPVDYKEQQVGIGYEILKSNVSQNVLIDLGTSFRFYSRFRGILDLKSGRPLLKIISVGNVQIKTDTGSEIINGKLILEKDNQKIDSATLVEQTNISAPIPEYYKLKVELTPNEYKKLRADVEYKLYTTTGDYHTLKIGLENESEPWLKNLAMDKALHFRTVPKAPENTTIIYISNPIVEFEKDDSFLGVVRIESAGIKTLESDESEHIINNPWIRVNNPLDYDGNNLGEHRVRITSGSNKYEGNTDSSGSSLTGVIGVGTNKVMWEYPGGNDKATFFGIDEYDFKGGKYDVKIEHLNLKNPNVVLKRYNYKINLPAFDGTVYLDRTLDIGKKPNYEKNYEIFSAPNGKIFLGSVGLKKLDRRITYNQYGGDGVSVRLLTQNVILKKEDNQQIIRGTLTIEENDSVNNQVRGVSREDRGARKGNVYLTLAPSEEEKLTAGGKYHILTVDNQEPLQVGVKANTGEFLKTVSELWLVTTQKYYKTDIKFKNDEMPLTSEKGWIDYETGIINGYTGNWGEIVGGNLRIPQGTTNVYLLDERGNKLTFGRNWEYDIPIGASKVTLKFDGGKLEFGVKAGNYIVGERGKFFLRYVSDTNYLKLEEVNVEFVLNKLTSKTTIEFLNPMMKTNPQGTALVDITGMVGFGTDRNGKTYSNGNHSYNHSDKRVWWNIQGAETYKTGELAYEIYNKTGNLLQTLGKDDSYKYWGITPNQVTYYIGFSENGNIDLGVYSGYKGNRVEDTIYLVGKNQAGKPIRYEEIKIVVDEFEPNAYGKVVPVENGIAIDEKEQQVGTGIENLKSDVQENILIDLGTNFRFYSRFRGIIDCIENGADFELNSVGNVIIKPKGDTSTVVRGNLKLVKESQKLTRLTMEEVTDLSLGARPEYYSLKVELTPEEYRKLIVNTEYEVFREDNNYHTLKIGLANKPNGILVKDLIMNKPLNFRTSGASIEIKVENDMLDFGRINLSQNRGVPIIREGYTYVTVIGNEINDFSLTPNNEQEGNTEIYLKNPDETLDRSKKLQVSKLKAEQVYEKKEENKLTRIYNFNGIVTVPLDSSVGEYLGETVINVTVIN